jgi:hypothetical protein
MVVNIAENGRMASNGERKPMKKNSNYKVFKIVKARA